MILALMLSVQMYIVFQDQSTMEMEVDRAICEQANARMAEEPVFFVIIETGVLKQALLILCRAEGDME